MHRFLPLFHAPDLRHPRPHVQRGSKIAQLPSRADRVNFHAAVVKVARPASNPQGIRFLLHEVAESHALHPAAYHPTLRNRSNHINILAG